MSEAEIKKRLAWQKRRPSRPLRRASTAAGWPPQLAGKGTLGLLVRRSFTHWAAQPPRWLGYTTNCASLRYSAFFHGA